MTNTFNVSRTRDFLRDFQFSAVFIEELGWSHPAARTPLAVQAGDVSASALPIAELGGVMVLEVTASDGGLPDARECALLHREISKAYHENVIIFLDTTRTQSLLYWVKRDGAKTFPRDHHFVKEQPGDLFLSKLAGMFVDISELDSDGKVPLLKVARLVSGALDVETVTKKFFGQFQEVHDRILLQYVSGIDDDSDRRWYVSVLLNRLMFVYFLQGKNFLPGHRYLQEKLAASKARGADRFYSGFLRALFFDGFAVPEASRTEEVKALIGDVRYLNGGLFLPHRIETENPDIAIPDAAFEELLADTEPKGLFARYSWNLDDSPGGKDDEMSPGTLGYIFEKYINQKEFGAYYTREEITEYLCEQTIHRLILDKVARFTMPSRVFESFGDLSTRLDADLCRILLHDVLPSLSLLDPACGSGAFLVAAMKTLVDVYGKVVQTVLWNKHERRYAKLYETVSGWAKEHRNLPYFIKREIIKNNLFGVDLNPEAVEIARLRLFLSLIASAKEIADLEPLPNIDFNLLPGNSLVGLLRVEADDFDKTAVLGEPTFGELIAQKNRAVAAYKAASALTDDVYALRQTVDDLRESAKARLDAILLTQFTGLNIRHEAATWDDAKNAEGKPLKSAVRLEHVAALQPFHWGYEFSDVLMGQGGFDAIITNPPWEIFKPQDKEFFAAQERTLEKELRTVTKNKMTIKDFETAKGTFLQNAVVRKCYLDYLSAYPYVSAFFRSAPQYKNQISLVNGKKAGTDINLYKLFTEQCQNLLRPGGYCGIVIPSGIYTDLGTKQLREMLFAETRVTGLFCFENRKTIFENVDSRFKFVVLSWEKGGVTTAFPTAFMRHDVKELQSFPRRGALNVSVAGIRAASPDSLSITEMKDERDFTIAEKFSRFPRLGETVPGTFQLILNREFDMTNDSHLFRTSPAPGRLPLYEGKMIHQFRADFAQPK